MSATAIERERLLGWPEVRRLIPLGRTTVWRLRRHGQFPAPVRLTRTRAAWRERDILAWLANREAVAVAAADAEGTAERAAIAS